MKKYLIIVPTYNEAENIGKLIKEILENKLSNTDMLIIDDNSPDMTRKIVKRIIKKNLSDNIFILNNGKKKGLGRAYIAGFKWALKKKYNYIITMDADFSHDPKYLSKIISKAKDNNIVIGSRFVKGGKIIGWKWYRYLNSYLANFFTKFLLGLKPKDTTAGFKCYNINFIKILELDKIISSGYAFQVEMIAKAQEKDFDIIEIPIIFTDRKDGKSKISGEIIKSAISVYKMFIMKKSLRQFIKFSIVGVSGTLIDLIVYNILAIIFGLNIYMARTISFVLAATNNYYLNRIWTFRNKDKSIALQFGKFFFISTIGLIMNLGIMKLLQPFSSKFESIFLQKNIPVIFAIIIVLFWNFFANKLWTFKEKK